MLLYLWGRALEGETSIHWTQSTIAVAPRRTIRPIGCGMDTGAIGTPLDLALAEITTDPVLHMLVAIATVPTTTKVSIRVHADKQITDDARDFIKVESLAINQTNAANRVAKKANEEKKVLTPGGYRPESLVHTVESSDVVIFDAKEIPVIEKQKEESLNEDLVLTPCGYRSKRLVHEVQKSQAVAFESQEKRFRVFDLSTNQDLFTFDLETSERVQLSSGWISYAYWETNAANLIRSFKTSWSVPNAPVTRSGQTIFLFNGIQNHGNDYGILQPVLQWGQSAAGGGEYWSIASWYVTSSGHAFHSPLTRVDTNQELIGVMTLIQGTEQRSDYHCEFTGFSNSSLNVQNINTLVWCNETLEAYSISKCSDYPNEPSTLFERIEIRTQQPIANVNWVPSNNVQDCGQHTDVLSDSAASGSVKISYR